MKNKIFSLGGLETEEKPIIEIEALDGSPMSKPLAVRLEEIDKAKEEQTKLVDIYKSCLMPFEDRVLIHPDKAPQKTDTGLYIPETAQAQLAPARGTVINVGPGKPDRPMALKPRMRVLYGNFAGQLVQDPFNKVEYLIMRMADVFIEIQGNEDKA